MITVTPSPQFRDASGRFARFDASDSIAAGLLRLGTDTVGKLQAASPVRTGRLQAGWVSTYFPSQKQIRISDSAPYWTYLITGTRRMPPNPALQAVIAGLPADAGVTLRGIGQDIIGRLMGG